MSTLSTNPEPSRLSRVWNSNMAYSFRQNPVAVVSMAIFLIITLAAILAPVFAPFDPYDPAQIDIMNSEYPPIWVEGADAQFIFGTDDQGRDLWSTILYGTRLSLLIGLCAVARMAFCSSVGCARSAPSSLLVLLIPPELAIAMLSSSRSNTSTTVHLTKSLDWCQVPSY